jgi:hypothetical protein
MVHDGDGKGLALANAERQSASAVIDIAAKVKAGGEHCKTTRLVDYRACDRSEFLIPAGIPG